MEIQNRATQRSLFPTALSSYFEFIRIAAALVVLLHHSWPAYFPDFPLPWPGHQAVVVFFVLSGYVIAATSTKPGLTLSNYILDRSSRILCVTVPALAFAGFVALYAGLPAFDVLVRSAANFFFVAQSWGLHASAPANGAYWSICYEVWYYAIFAAAIFSRSKSRWWLVGALCIAAGPNILLLMPCWLLGVVLFKYQDRLRVTAGTAKALFLFSIIAYSLYYWFDVGVEIREGLRPDVPEITSILRVSNLFIGDTILAFIIAVNFVAVASFAGSAASILDRCKPIFAFAASCTLSVYLFHLPIITLAKEWGLTGITPMIATLVLPVMLASLTEHRRKSWRAVLARIFPNNRRVSI